MLALMRTSKRGNLKMRMTKSSRQLQVIGSS